MRGTIARFAAAALAIAFAAGPVQAACKLGEKAELTVTMAGLRPLISAKLNNVDAHLIVDTGGFFSMLSPSTVQRLGLTTYPAPYGFVARGATGTANLRVTKIKKLGFVGVDLPDTEFLVEEHDMGGGDGTIGQNLMTAFDMECDFANGAMRMMDSHTCGDQILAYWAKPDAGIGMMTIDPIEPPNNALRGSITLNGQRLRVEFDTGFTRSVLTLRGARQAGLSIDAPGVVSAGVQGGIGRKVARSWIVPAASLDIGGEKITTGKLLVSDLDLEGIDMLIGADSSCRTGSMSPSVSAKCISPTTADRCSTWTSRRSPP
jgi:predicted aspartyl protease